MKPVFVLGTAVVISAILAFGGGVSAHTGEEGAAMPMTGSSMMREMMEVMHGKLDASGSFDCGKMTDAQMMEAGEEMMEAIFGKEDHERVEREMEKDRRDHDAMHTMMGMWATGCVGDETVNTLMEKYGISGNLSDRRIGSFDWPAAVIGAIIGLAIGWVASVLIKKRSDKPAV